jgi:hypothetical protein
MLSGLYLGNPKELRHILSVPNEDDTESHENDYD